MRLNIEAEIIILLKNSGNKSSLRSPLLPALNIPKWITAWRSRYARVGKDRSEVPLFNVETTCASMSV
jgi:hypothetical protein